MKVFRSKVNGTNKSGEPFFIKDEENGTVGNGWEKYDVAQMRVKYLRAVLQ